MADLKLGSRLLRNLVKHTHPRDHEFCQISYYSSATGEEIESNSRGMPGPPPLGLNIDRCIKLEKNTKRKIIKLNIFYLVEKIVRFHVDCRQQIRIVYSKSNSWISCNTIFLSSVNQLSGEQLALSHFIYT